MIASLALLAGLDLILSKEARQWYTGMNFVERSMAIPQIDAQTWRADNCYSDRYEDIVRFYIKLAIRWEDKEQMRFDLAHRSVRTFLSTRNRHSKPIHSRSKSERT